MLKEKAFIMENDIYILKNNNSREYRFICISRDKSRFQEYVSNVETYLRLCNASAGFILFDLLLSNDIDDRFYKYYFNGNIFVQNTFSRVGYSELDKETVRNSSEYYSNNEYLFEDIFYTGEYKKYILKKLKELIN